MWNLLLVLFDLHDLGDAVRVPAFGVWRAEKDLDDLAYLPVAEKIAADAQDVAVIVLAGASRGDLIVHETGPHTVNLVRANRHSDAAAVEQDADLGLALYDAFCDRDSEIRIVTRVAIVAPEILDVVIQFFDYRQKLALRLVPAV